MTKINISVIGSNGYTINSDGTVIGKNGRYLKPDTSSGYARVRLSNNGIKTVFSIHRLVAYKFLQAIEGKNYVNHKDSNTLNNDVSNLEWCTTSENIKHGFEYGNKIPTFSFGTSHKDAKLTEENVKSIREERETLGTSYRKMSKKYGVHHEQIRQICKGKAWQHV